MEFVVGNMMLSKVRGSFEKFAVEIELDEEHPENASVEAPIDASRINTRDAPRDGHQQSPDFLNVAEYPTLLFRSSRVERTGEGRPKSLET